MNDDSCISLNDYIRHLQSIAAKGYGDCAMLVTAPDGEGYARVAGNEQRRAKALALVEAHGLLEPRRAGNLVLFRSAKGKENAA
jgi:hypothetical protein